MPLRSSFTKDAFIDAAFKIVGQRDGTILRHAPCQRIELLYHAYLFLPEIDEQPV